MRNLYLTLSYVVPVKSKVEISHNVLVSSDYMNFTRKTKWKDFETCLEYCFYPNIAKLSDDESLRTVWKLNGNVPDGKIPFQLLEPGRKKLKSYIKQPIMIAITQWKMDRKKRNLNCFYSISANRRKQNYWSLWKNMHQSMSRNWENSSSMLQSLKSFFYVFLWFWT